MLKWLLILAHKWKKGDYLRRIYMEERGLSKSNLHGKQPLQITTVVFHVNLFKVKMELGGYVVRENYGISCLPVGLISPIMLFVLFV